MAQYPSTLCFNNIDQSLSIFFTNSAIPGPVQNLKCDYNFMEEKPLRCTWLAPKDVHADLQIFSVKVKYGSHILHYGPTTGTMYEARPDFIPEPNLVFEVIVSAKTQPEGFPASTILNLLHFGELLSLLIHQTVSNHALDDSYLTKAGILEKYL